MSNISNTATIIQIPTQANEDWILEEIDLIIRAMGNPKISPVYFRLYSAFIDRWPDILTGRLIEDFSPWQLRERAGWVSKESVTKFLNDLKAITAILEYDPGKPTMDDQGHKERIGTIRGNPDVMPYPETFLLCETDQRKKERDAQKERDAHRALILNCQLCGSPDMKYDLLPTCKKCGHKHQAIINIPVARISLDGESESLADDLPDFDSPLPVQRNTEPINPVAVKIPRCKHWKCAIGVNNVEIRPWGLFCKSHNGYVDKDGIPQ